MDSDENNHLWLRKHHPDFNMFINKNRLNEIPMLNKENKALFLNNNFYFNNWSKTMIDFEAK